jgi:hypothetical protein
MADVILSPEEIHRITGYRQPRRQLQVLRERGFWRAECRRVAGELRVILERPHYDAVSAGALVEPGGAQRQPQVRPPQLRSV